MFLDSCVFSLLRIALKQKNQNQRIPQMKRTREPTSKRQAEASHDSDVSNPTKKKATEATPTSTRALTKPTEGGDDPTKDLSLEELQELFNQNTEELKRKELQRKVSEQTTALARQNREQKTALARQNRERDVSENQNHFRRALNNSLWDDDLSFLLKNLTPRFFLEKEFEDRVKAKKALETLFEEQEFESKRLTVDKVMRILFPTKEQASESEPRKLGFPENVSVKNEKGGKLFVVDTYARLTEFFPCQFIYVRDCYTDLYKMILNYVGSEPSTKQPKNALIIGDPGIGKTTMLRFVFLKLKDKQEKVFWLSQSGQWVYFDGEQYHDGDKKTEFWQDNKVWLLLDGRVPRVFLRKLNRVVVFASRNKQNYHEFAKTAHPLQLVMPAWEYHEVDEFLRMKISDKDPDIALKIMEPFVKRLEDRYTAMRNQEQHEIEQYAGDDDKITKDQTDPANPTAGYLSEFDCCRLIRDKDGLESSPYESIYGYDDEVEFFKIFQSNTAESPKVGDASSGDANNQRDISREAIEPRLVECIHRTVEKRFLVIGGRIRQLLNPVLTYRALVRYVEKSVERLQLSELERESVLDVHENVPSVVYTMGNMEKDYETLNVKFATDFIGQLVTDRVVWEYRSRLHDLWNNLSHTSLAGALYGHVFERIVIRDIFAMRKKWDLELMAPKEEKTGNSERGSGFDILEICEKLHLRHFKVSNESEDRAASLDQTLFIPSWQNQAQVDAVYPDKKALFQMTVSRRHSFIPHHINKVCKFFGFKPEEAKFIFVVPESNYASFKYQNPQRIDGTVMTRPPNRIIKQYKMMISNDTLNECFKEKKMFAGI